MGRGQGKKGTQGMSPWAYLKLNNKLCYSWKSLASTAYGSSRHQDSNSEIRSYLLGGEAQMNSEAGERSCHPQLKCGLPLDRDFVFESAV